MSDQKKFEQMMGSHVDRQLERKWMKEHEPRAVKHFTRPANVCEICGLYMSVDPVTGRDYTMSEWERKWSIHSHCKEEVVAQLDRASQMSAGRQ